MKKTVFLFCFFGLVFNLLSSHVLAQCTVANGGFESWLQDTSATNKKFKRPTSWQLMVDPYNSDTSDIEATTTAGDVVEGTYSMTLATGSDSVFPAIQFKQSCTDSPFRFTGYYKFSGSASDSVGIGLFITDKNGVSGQIYGGGVLYFQPDTDFVKVNTLIPYSSWPSSDSVYIDITVGTYADQPKYININSPGISVTLDSFALQSKTLSAVGSLSKEVPHFKIVPNPASNSLSITFERSTAIDKVALYDVVGTEVIEADISPTDNRLSMDVSGLAPGVYFLEVVEGASTQVRKVMIH